MAPAAVHNFLDSFISGLSTAAAINFPGKVFYCIDTHVKYCNSS